ncbi:MAG: VWA domain-containing protein, partial [Herpetosiphon sp.]|nr:VWA domain-containing protein [Herpetosiphon sp.]
PLTALGVGDDWNEDLLIEMGNRSGGTAEYFQNPQDISEFFQGTVQQAQGSVVQNAALSLRLVQGVEPRAVWQVTPLIQNLGYKPIADRAVGVSLGEISKDERRVILVELLVEAKQPGQYRIGQAEVNYDVPQLNITGEKTRFDVMLNFVADPAQATGVVPQVMNIVEKVSAHKLQTRALEDVAAGNIGAATQKLQGAVTRLLNQGEVDLANTMQEEIQNLQDKGQMTSAGQKTIKFGTRKTVRLSDIDLPKE